MTDQFEDFSTRDGAYALVEQIREYWRDRRLDYGLSIHAEPVQKKSFSTGDRTVWGIKSNMVNGYPPAFFMVK
jgi:hypothetical protein